MSPKELILMPRRLRPCLQCSKPTRNERYCSRSCAIKNRNPLANYNATRKASPVVRKCRKCGVVIGEGYQCVRRVCDDCNINKRRWNNVTISELVSKVGTYQAHARIRMLARNLFQRLGGKLVCQRCGYSRHAEVCHLQQIRSHEPETTVVSHANRPSNLAALCRNCHWELDHGYLAPESITPLLSGPGVEPGRGSNEHPLGTAPPDHK